MNGDEFSFVIQEENTKPLDNAPVEKELDKVNTTVDLEASNPQIADSIARSCKKFPSRRVEFLEDRDSDEENAILTEVEDNSTLSKSQASVEDSNSHASLCK